MDGGIIMPNAKNVFKDLVESSQNYKEFCEKVIEKGLLPISVGIGTQNKSGGIDWVINERGENDYITLAFMYEFRIPEVGVSHKISKTTLVLMGNNYPEFFNDKEKIFRIDNNDEVKFLVFIFKDIPIENKNDLVVQSFFSALSVAV